MYTEGDEVLFIDGNWKGKFGTYLYHDYDSGYYVPFVKLHESGFITKPWDREIVNIKDLECKEKLLEYELKECRDTIDLWRESYDRKK